MYDHFVTESYPAGLYCDEITPNIFNIKESNLQVDIFQTKKINSISLFVIEH